MHEQVGELAATGTRRFAVEHEYAVANGLQALERFDRRVNVQRDFLRWWALAGLVRCCVEEIGDRYDDCAHKTSLMKAVYSHCLLAMKIAEKQRQSWSKKAKTPNAKCASCATKTSRKKRTKQEQSNRTLIYIALIQCFKPIAGKKITLSLIERFEAKTLATWKNHLYQETDTVVCKRDRLKPCN